MKSTNLLGLSLMAATVAVGNDEHVKADRDKSATRAGCRLMAVSHVTNSQAPAAVRSFAAEREGNEDRRFLSAVDKTICAVDSWADGDCDFTGNHRCSQPSRDDHRIWTPTFHKVYTKTSRPI